MLPAELLSSILVRIEEPSVVASLNRFGRFLVTTDHYWRAYAHHWYHPAFESEPRIDLVEPVGRIFSDDGRYIISLNAIRRKLEPLDQVFWAAENNYPALIDRLREQGAPIDQPYRTRRTPLYEAARLGHLDVVIRLAQHGADIDYTSRIGSTPLYTAAQNGHLATVHWLAEAGARLEPTLTDHEDAAGATSLYVAASHGHPEVVAYLIGRGANLEAALNNGCSIGATPLYIAAYYGHLSCLELLLRAGANLEAALLTGGAGATALYVACQNGHLEVVQRLIRAGAQHEVRLRDGSRHSSLIAAVRKEHPEVVRYLVSLSRLGRSSRDRGAETLTRGRDRGAETLTRGQDFINYQDMAGWTALHWAVYRNNLTIVWTLLQSGIDRTLTNNLGQTAFDLIQGPLLDFARDPFV